MRPERVVCRQLLRNLSRKRFIQTTLNVESSQLSQLEFGVPRELFPFAVETMPSFAPSTAARSQPIRSVRCASSCSSVIFVTIGLFVGISNPV